MEQRGPLGCLLEKATQEDERPQPATDETPATPGSLLVAVTLPGAPTLHLGSCNKEDAVASGGTPSQLRWCPTAPHSLLRQQPRTLCPDRLATSQSGYAVTEPNLCLEKQNEGERRV